MARSRPDSANFGLVPMSGFYEWRAVPGGKVPHYIHPADQDGILGVAGSWERWEKDHDRLDTFTIITTTPNTLGSTPRPSPGPSRPC